MATPAFRVPQRVGAQHYKTWRISAPPSTHWRPATCEEVDCTNWRNGWLTVVPAGTAHEYTARTCGRAFTEERRDGGRIAFTFHAGQPCFEAPAHRVRVERPELFVVRDGDWRGNPAGTRPTVYDRPDQWVDDFASHQDRLRSTRGE